MGWQIGVMVMSDSTEPLTALLTFYEKANFALRTALLITVFWPFSVIGAAMVLNPATAQTIVPIVDLIPLAAVFFVIIGAPFGLVALLSNPTARKGLTWLAALIGVELAIGVYFSTVPISKDIGLVPLLILASLALLFLRIGGIAGFLTKALAVVIIAITFIFIFGGRRRFEGQIENTLSPPHTAGQSNAIASSASANTPGEVVREEICPGSAPLDYGNFQGTQFVVNMRSGCFSGMIQLPRAWSPGWKTRPVGNLAGWWISFWFDGYPTPDAPVPLGQGKQFANHPMALRVEGRGDVMFYPGNPSTPPPTLASDPANQPPPQTQAPLQPQVVAQPQAEPATSSPITSGPVAATKDADVFHFGFWPCRRAAAATFCEGFLENESSQQSYEGILPSDVKDDLGNDYAFEAFTINSFSCSGRRGGCWPDIGAKDSQGIKFQVDGVVPQATSLVLFIHLTTHGSAFALPPGFDNTQAQDFSITIPISGTQ